VGLLASYLLRPSAATLKTLEEHKRRHAWASPVVGVHVRRTDKVAWGEAKAQPLQNYMRQVGGTCRGLTRLTTLRLREPPLPVCMCLQVELFCDLHLPSGWADRPATVSVELAGAGMEPELAAASFVTPNNSSGARGTSPLTSRQ
jgi:hypothetical protein